MRKLTQTMSGVMEVNGLTDLRGAETEGISLAIIVIAFLL